MTSLHIGQTISKLRKENGLTQSDLASCVGVSPKTVSKWETGNGCPDLGMLPRLSQALHVSIDRIMTGSDYSGESIATESTKEATVSAKDVATKAALKLDSTKFLIHVFAIFLFATLIAIAVLLTAQLLYEQQPAVNEQPPMAEIVTTVPYGKYFTSLGMSDVVWISALTDSGEKECTCNVELLPFNILVEIYGYGIDGLGEGAKPYVSVVPCLDAVVNKANCKALTHVDASHNLFFHILSSSGECRIVAQDNGVKLLILHPNQTYDFRIYFVYNGQMAYRDFRAVTSSFTYESP